MKVEFELYLDVGCGLSAPAHALYSLAARLEIL